MGWHPVRTADSRNISAMVLSLMSQDILLAREGGVKRNGVLGFSPQRRKGQFVREAHPFLREGFNPRYLRSSGRRSMAKPHRLSYKPIWPDASLRLLRTLVRPVIRLFSRILLLASLSAKKSSSDLDFCGAGSNRTRYVVPLSLTRLLASPTFSRNDSASCTRLVESPHPVKSEADRISETVTSFSTIPLNCISSRSSSVSS